MRGGADGTAAAAEDDGGIEEVLPRLTSGDAIACVRFLMGWMDAEPRTAVGQLHHRLLAFTDKGQRNIINNNNKGGKNDIYDEQTSLSAYTFQMELLPSMVQCLSESVTCGPTRTSDPSQVRNALLHVMSDGHAGNSRNRHAASARAMAVAEKLLAAARSTQYRSPVVLLLFHPNEAVRTWARETILRLVNVAFSSASVGSTAEAAAHNAWLLGMQLLCTIRHLACIPLNVREEGPRGVVADGFCGLLAVLTAVDTKLAVLERTLLQDAAAAGQAAPVLFHGVSSATIALLGGSMVLDWLLAASSPSSLSAPSGDAPTTTTTTPLAQGLAVALNLRLGAETTLQPLSLALDTRRTLVKTLVHCLLDNAKRAVTTSESERARCQRRMRDLWCVAAHIDPPPSSSPSPAAGTKTTAAGAACCPPGKSAGWLLRFLIRNASVQLNLRVAVQGAADSSSDNESRLRTMETAVHALGGMLTALSGALPDLATSLFYHDFLRSIQKDCVTLAVGVALRSKDPRAALTLLRHFMQTDLAVFGRCQPPHPGECLRAAWEALPDMVQRIAKLPDERARLSSPPLLPQTMELFDLTLAQLSVCAWLLLKPLKDGPPPLAGVVGKCMRRLTEVVQGSMKNLQRQWEAVTGNSNSSSLCEASAAAASRLLSSGSPIPRVAHVLMMSSDVVVRSLGEALSALFLHSFTPVVHNTFRADAANWLLQAALHDPVLQAHPLKLHNAKVDAVARSSGVAWTTVMCGCNWSNLPHEALAASWWLCALLADVCILEKEMRHRLLELVITQLPSIFDVPPARAASNDAVASESSASLTPGAVDSDTASHRIAQQPLRQCAQRLLLVLVQKCSLYDVSTFCSAVLHVASAQPPPTRSQPDVVFRNALSTAFVAALQQLPEEARNTLTEYAPAWLVDILSSARRNINDSVADQNRRFQEYEFEEKRLKQLEEEEQKRVQQEEAMCRANRELRRHELEHQRGEGTTCAASRVILPNSGLKRVREAEEPRLPSLLIAQTPSATDASNVLVTSELCPQQQQRLRVEQTVAAETVPGAQQRSEASRRATPLQKHLQQLGERRLDAYIRAENLGNSAEAIRRVACSTDVLRRPIRVDDIIGHGRSCLAREVPHIPQIFPAALQRGCDFYVSSFLPHIALELRYELLHKFDEMVDVCRSRESAKGYGSGENRGTPSAMRSRVASASVKGPPSVSAWVVENATAVMAAGAAVPNMLEPAKLEFAVMPKVTPGAAPVVASLIAALSEGDVVVVLLPLPRVTASLPHLLNTVDGLPEAWRLLGCIPQLCVVTLLQPGQRTATLTMFTPASQSFSSAAASGGNGGGAGAVPVPFSHALRVFLTSKEHFYVKRLIPLGPSLASVAAMHNIQRKAFLNTLLEPHLAAKGCRAYHNAVKRELLMGDRWDALTRGILLHSSLNEWQMRAIASVLTAAVPGWETETLRTLLPSTILPMPPDLFIIEGPPGTGKTQTIAALTLNLLHYLPKSGRRVLVCAASNCAVDEVLLRVQSLAKRVPQLGELQLLRVGVRESVDREVLAATPPLFLDDCVGMLSDASHTSRSVTTGRVVRNGNTDGVNNGNGSSSSNGGSGRQMLRDQLLRGAHVVCSTLGSLSQLQRLDCLFDMVIVDEASQGTEPDVLQALMFAKRRAVLVGDSKQLQPTVLCQAAAVRGLKRSLLQRLLHQGHRSSLLRTQYRMHPDICAFPNRYFYGGKLHTHASVLSRQLVAPSNALPMLTTMGKAPRLAFVNVQDGRMEWGRGRSLMNRREAEAVVTQMRRFRAFLRLSPEAFAPHIGIITFYQAQREAIVRLLSREERSSELQIATVDSFQGKEKNIIFISCVRAPHAAAARTDGAVTLGFMEDWHRINVSLTRAKEFCVVFGHRQTFHDAAASAAMQQQQQQQQQEDLTPSGLAGDAHVEGNSDSDGDAVQEVVAPMPKSDDDPFVIERLAQRVEYLSAQQEKQQRQQSQEALENGETAAFFTNSGELHLLRELLLDS
ncbi:putative nonsense mRNA reducing factor 1 [Trypanosoma grayi]|uniref:putative nonsense mRNA reducing factor 1 n=1 Tax=Trypanosoma grayi TaxID=71804 RepID=UPI0004F49D4A|nr:putative nonsense mRNA reducing factor 1 [Trypanosoma grayi]KEG11356.1 putative nonsense mRNA reducing factor 1 [Trypanosoma grayi]